MEKQVTKFTVPSYTKTELAQMIMPNVAAPTALRQFNKWLKDNETLGQALRESGVKPSTRRYSPLQVRLIFKYIGTP